MKIGTAPYASMFPYRMKPADMQAAMANRGGDNLRVRLLIDKFKSGKELAPDEMHYLRLHAPGEIEWIERIATERDTLKSFMRLAPTRTDVRMTVLLATHRTARNESAEQRLVRARQFADAEARYMQTHEYRNKPDLFPNKRPGI